jgi:hypothetical protein
LLLLSPPPPPPAWTALPYRCPSTYTHTHTHTPHPPPSALRADKVPRSHSTALAPCIGPARVNTAQSALDPDPLAFLLCFSASLCTTNRRSGHNLNSPTATAFPPNSHPPLDYSVSSPHRPPAAVAALLIYYCPALSLPASPVVHKHFLAAPPTTVSAAAARRPHTILAVSR